MSEKYKDSEEDLISSIGRKVLYCSGCETADFEHQTLPEIPNEKGKLFKHCPYCGDKLNMRREDRIKEHREVKVLLIDRNAPRDSVTRLMDSPWGRIKVHVSTHSFFAPFVTKADPVEIKYWDSGTASKEPKTDIVYPEMPAIKRIIDEEFSDEAIQKSLTELGPYTPGTEPWPVTAFLGNLWNMVTGIHRDPNAVPSLDLTKEVIAA